MIDWLKRIISLKGTIFEPEIKEDKHQVKNSTNIDLGNQKNIYSSKNEDSDKPIKRLRIKGEISNHTLSNSKYFNEIRTSNLVREEEIIGYNETEVREMEKLLERSLPLAIREFMLLLGKQIPIYTPMGEIIFKKKYIAELISVMSNSQNLELQKIKNDPFLLIGITDSAEELYGEYLWTIVHLNNDENPQLIKIDSNSKIYNSKYRFSEYIFNLIEKSRDREKLFIRYTSFHMECTLRFINYTKVKSLNIQLGDIDDKKLYTLLTKLVNLEELYIEEEWTKKGWIKELNFPRLLHLRSVYINLPKLSKFKFENQGFKDLSRLTIKGDLSELPDELAGLRNLKRLSISGDSLINFPLVVCNIISLEDLAIIGGVNEIPEEIGNLKMLTSLNLKNNNLISLPESLVKLERLAKLDLSGNIMSTINSDFSKLKSLKKINLSANCLPISEIKKINDIMISAEVSTWNQKPNIRKNYNTSHEFKIEVEANLFDRYVEVLEFNKFHYSLGNNLTSNTRFILSNNLEYSGAIDILNKLKETDENMR